MSTSLDTNLSIPWSKTSKSVVNPHSKEKEDSNSSCLYDLVNGIYLIDSHHLEVKIITSFKV